MKKVITIILLSCLLIITGCSKEQKGNPLVGIWHYEDFDIPIKKDLYLDCENRFYESGINYPSEIFENSGTYELVDTKVNLYSNGELYQNYSYQEHSKDGKTRYYFYDGNWEDPDHRFSGQRKTCKEMKALIDEKLAVNHILLEEYIGTYKNNQGKVITISKDSKGKIRIDKQVIHKPKKNDGSFIRLYEQPLGATVQGEHKVFYDLYPSGVSLYYTEFSPSQNSEFPDAVEPVEKETTTYQPRILISDNYSSFIELEDIYIKVSESDVTIKDYTGLKYEEVKKELEDLGLIVMEKYLDGPLTKYELQAYYDLGYQWEDKNIIYQSITPGTVVSTKTVIKFGIFSMGDY